MDPEIAAAAAASPGDRERPHVVTYLVTTAEDGDMETGTVFLDERAIGRLSRRLQGPAGPTGAGDPSSDIASVWHARAVGWLPHDGRPWDTRITSTAPTRRRAAEDLLRAYRNHR